jgi:hypothetical protein
MNMKHLIVVFCTLLLVVAGCKKDDSKELDTLVGNVAEPTWVKPTEYDYSSSMTVVLKVDLAAQYPTLASDFTVSPDDRLAAFDGEKCCGVAMYEQTTGLFLLYITMPTADEPSENAKMLNIRYWSAHYKNIFAATELVQFVNDGRLGTTSEPFAPLFALEK